MGIIKPEIAADFEAKCGGQYSFLKAFIHGFNINYFASREASNTYLWTYILEPENFIKESFGFEKEILLVYSPFNLMEPRSVQALTQIQRQYPFDRRVDSLNCFFISDDPNVNQWFEQETITSDGLKIIVPFFSGELKENCNDSWYVRNKLRNNFFGLDLFASFLPLNDDTYFFGRQQIVARYIDSIKRCENRGIFGLRKTGKTSLIRKVERVVREQRLGFTFYYDCKSPSYRKMHWNQLLGEICSNIAKRINVFVKKDYDEINIIKSFRYLMKEASVQKKKIILMFDEIEYISFRAPIDSHWHTEYIDFWQTIWSVQSLHRNLVFIVGGVNPSVAEVDIVNGIQNPLFGIVQSDYLTGLTNDELRTMVRTLGKRMGINFTHDAINKLECDYGGHPMLTRLACSIIHQMIDQRPHEITQGKLQGLQEDIDTSLAYYFQHVVSEIKQFYPEEYEMFELLASGHTADFYELAQHQEFVKHLYLYGLVKDNSTGMPEISMPVAGKYVAMQLAAAEGRSSAFKVIDASRRDLWLKQRLGAIANDMRQLERLIGLQSQMPLLFGQNSFPEGDRFIEIPISNNRSHYTDFLNIINRCFVESIENYGESLGKKQYFWTDIKVSYPDLFSSLERIKTYRNAVDHVKLKQQVAQKYESYYAHDTFGISDENEKFFCIQQRLLEGLFIGIQSEINKLS